MTILDALETIDKSVDKLALFNTLLSESLEPGATYPNLNNPVLKNGLYHFLGDVADDLRLASDVMNIFMLEQQEGGAA